MFKGYSSEHREEFYASGAFEALAPFIHHLNEMTNQDENIVDCIGKEMAHDYCCKASKIIVTLFKMVQDARADIEAMKEAANHAKQ